MLRHRDARSEHLQGLRALFEMALQRCQRLWGDFAFKRPEGAGWRDQTLAGMYDAEMLAVAQVEEAVFDRACADSKTILAKTRALFEDTQFEESVRLGTNTPSRIHYRVEQVVAMLHGHS